MRFVLEDFDKLQEEAYEKAIADARTRAERLARLSKVELGPIVAIREIVGARRTGRANADDEPPRKAARDVEVPGDPGARGAPGAFRGSSQIRRQREEPSDDDRQSITF